MHAQAHIRVIRIWSSQNMVAYIFFDCWMIKWIDFNPTILKDDPNASNLYFLKCKNETGEMSAVWQSWP